MRAVCFICSCLFLLEVRNGLCVACLPGFRNFFSRATFLSSEMCRNLREPRQTHNPSSSRFSLRSILQFFGSSVLQFFSFHSSRLHEHDPLSMLSSLNSTTQYDEQTTIPCAHTRAAVYAKLRQHYASAREETKRNRK